jgi:hypothetical protein
VALRDTGGMKCLRGSQWLTQTVGRRKVAGSNLGRVIANLIQVSRILAKR